MKANALHLLSIFDTKTRLEVPLFQRQYVWNQESHWEPLWEDIERKFSEYLEDRKESPQHAAVFCVDEKTAIQALDRLDPVLPLSPGRAERHGFEYYRHGTLSLYAALNTPDGQVLGRTVDRHTSIEFVGFLHQVVASQPSGREIHVILHNLSAHKSAVVQDFLTLNPCLVAAPPFAAKPSTIPISKSKKFRGRARYVRMGP